MNEYTLYIVNSLSGRFRDLKMRTTNSYMARKLCSECCLKDNEEIKCIYPSRRELPYEN